ncbi:hypothetical protein [Streptomyces parvus]|uniref:hypothetical protein n=1 Tax=Streptomyces parvus TaxID=66428 RepID=UPI002101653A|nr:hypothetical protein [Streptomyces parvus]MCQ1577188.1 hypothetical protein [Streptomyces parvus]
MSGTRTAERAAAPSVPADIPATAPGTVSGWRLVVTAVPARARAVRDLDGLWLAPGALVALPDGALVLAIDVHDAPRRWTITALRAAPDGLEEAGRWERRSPLGPREINVLHALLAGDAASHTVRVLAEPNRAPAACRACDRTLPAGQGLAYRTPAGHVTTCRACPLPLFGVNPDAGRCVRCSGWVTAGEGLLAPAPGAPGRYRPVHRACPDQPLPGPPLRTATWCLECRTTVPAGTGYWDRGPHHAPGHCALPADGLPRWSVRVPARESTDWAPGQVRRIRHTPAVGEPALPEGLPGGRILADNGHMTVLAHVLDTRTTGASFTLALVRAATWIEAAPLLAAELDQALATRPDGGTFLARQVVERICGDRGWVAEITGHDPRHGLTREFLHPQTDYDQADAHGHRGVLDAWTLRPRRVYEVSRPLGPPAKDWRAVRRRLGRRARVTAEHRAFVRVTAEGDIVEITEEEVQVWLAVALEWMS